VVLLTTAGPVRPNVGDPWARYRRGRFRWYSSPVIVRTALASALALLVSCGGQSGHRPDASGGTHEQAGAAGLVDSARAGGAGSSEAGPTTEPGDSSGGSSEPATGSGGTRHTAGSPSAGTPVAPEAGGGAGGAGLAPPSHAGAGGAASESAGAAGAGGASGQGGTAGVAGEAPVECVPPLVPCIGDCTDPCVPGRTIICGNALLEKGESCDDANTESSDGCSERCSIEEGFVCPVPGQLCLRIDELPNCGNAITERDLFEQCDDGANTGEYGTCAPGCVLGPRCGDGVVQGPEQCDQGDNLGGYGACAAGCMLGPRCGDGVVELGYEDCDDGNLVNGDGCEADCHLFYPVGD
jgi:cysteine-rich repeat protein